MPQVINTNDLPDVSGPLPVGTYTVQIVDVKQEPSKKYSPMDTFECQILSPDVVQNGASKVAAAGRKFTIWQSYGIAALRRAKENLAKLGIDIPTEVAMPTEDEVRSGAYKRIPEIQDLTRSLKGMCFEMQLQTKPRTKTDTGRRDGRPMLDEAGQPIIAGHDIDADLGAAVSPARDV